MGKSYRELDEPLRDFISQQKQFFVATAPLDAQGHVNVSPKGRDSLRVLGPTKVAYLNFTGNGIETVAHVRENGRLTLMFCAFQGPPRILRECRELSMRDRPSARSRDALISEA